MSVRKKKIRKERIDRGIKVRSEGIYALSSWREITYLTFPRLILIIGVLAGPILVPGLYWKRVLSIAAIYGLLAMSFDFLANTVGLVLLGGAFFTGVGAYFTGSLNSYLGLSPFLSISIATVGGAVFSTLLLFPCLSLRGVYFAIATLIYPLLFERIIAAANILGGTEGLSGLDPLPGQGVEIYLPLVVLLLVLFVLRRLVNSDLGLILRAIKDSHRSVSASGINVTLYRVVAVLIGSGIGCFSGAFLAHLYAWAGMSSFALDFSVFPIAATVVGGSGSLVGPVLGSFILTPLSEMLREFGTLRIVFYALVIVFFVIWRSEGLFKTLQRKYEQFERWIEVQQ